MALSMAFASAVTECVWLWYKLSLFEFKRTLNSSVKELEKLGRGHILLSQMSISGDLELLQQNTKKVGEGKS